MPNVFKACKNCPDRIPGCHDHCDKHKSEKDKWARLKAQANLGIDADRYLKDRRCKAYSKNATKRKNYNWYGY